MVLLDVPFDHGSLRPVQNKRYTVTLPIRSKMESYYQSSPGRQVDGELVSGLSPRGCFPVSEVTDTVMAATAIEVA